MRGSQSKEDIYIYMREREREERERDGEWRREELGEVRVKKIYIYI